MAWLTGILAWIKALSFFSKFGGLLALVPGIGPVGALFSTLFNILIQIVTYLVKSLWECVKDPMTWGVVGCAIIWGIVVGIRWDAHLVDVAHAQLRTYVRSAQGAINVEKSTADAARAAADAAERKAAAVVVPPLNCTTNANSSVAPAKPSVVRNYRKPRASVYTIPGLPGF